MIGMINIPNDSPAEFYASSPRRFFSELGPSPSTEIDIDALSIDDKISPHQHSKSSFLNIFNRRKHTHQVGYLSDGRKVFDGQVINPHSVPKMWEQLIVRSMVHKMEDEISSPAEQYIAIQAALPKLSRQNSSSTYSLVSQNRVQSQCEKCSPKKLFGMENIKQFSFLSKSSTKLHNRCDSNSSSSSMEENHKTSNGSKYLSPSKKIIRRRSRNSASRN